MPSRVWPAWPRPVVDPLVAAADRAQVEVDLAAAAQQYGLKPGDIRRDATTLTSGLIVGSLYEQAEDLRRRGLGRAADAQTDLTEPAGPADRHPVRRPGRASATSPPVTRRRRAGRDRARRGAPAASRWPPGERPHPGRRRRRRAAPGSRPCRCRTSTTPRCSAAPRPRSSDLRPTARRTCAVALVGIFLLLQAATQQLAAAGAAAPARCRCPLAGGGADRAAGRAGSAHRRAAGRLCSPSSRSPSAHGVLLMRAANPPDTIDLTDGGCGPRTGVPGQLVPVIATALATAALLLPAAVLGDRAGTELLHPFAVTFLGGLVTLHLRRCCFVLPAVAAAWPGPAAAVPSRDGGQPRRHRLPHASPSDRIRR